MSNRNAAAAVAIPWTQKGLGFTNLASAELKANRDSGLLQATRVGNPQVPSLSHQLEP